MKKYKNYIFPALLLLATLPAAAQSITPNQPYTLSTMVESMGNTLLFIMLGISLVMLVMVFFVYNAVSSLQDKILAETNPAYAARAKQTFWGRVFKVPHTSTDKDVILDHNYDDIHELDNPIPGWFMWLFYGTVVAAVVYLLNFHVFNTGKLQLEEYTTQLEKADADYQIYLKTAGDRINEETVTQLTDNNSIQAGKAVFLKPGSCVSCHGPEGGGTAAAPNLTDEYWLHGGGIKNIFKTISHGVPNTGMKAWNKDYSTVEIQQIASFVLSLQGTKPANAREPQGEKWVETATSLN
jgi:cytochrome c oxidase cbb3-type subunit III